MDFDYLKSLDDEALKAEIQKMSRSDMDEQFRWLGGQRAVLSQKLEAVYTTSREGRFVAIRPGGLEDIDNIIQLAKTDHQKELTLLAAYRDLNRVLLYFMDAYEEHVLGDLKHLSKEELQDLYTKVMEQLKTSQELLKNPATDYRKGQDSSGKLRLAGLFKEALLKELKERFGYEPETA
jgi:hypothetical protein